jgi:hypothetical protein
MFAFFSPAAQEEQIIGARPVFVNRILLTRRCPGAGRFPQEKQ